MELKCPVCHKQEKVSLYPNNVIHFACGYERIETQHDIIELFRKYGGER
jgi:Zn ribbon nucleic-acid-binding protein